mmetsp:Transcript_16337/g.40705  ORF Transcript_16337/g.40705 Transcript_16337/m.40705 type:complete len:276 (+) Transcript_16337:1900-2727(+)
MTPSVAEECSPLLLPSPWLAPSSSPSSSATAAMSLLPCSGAPPPLPTALLRMAGALFAIALASLLSLPLLSCTPADRDSLALSILPPILSFACTISALALSILSPRLSFARSTLSPRLSLSLSIFSLNASPFSDPSAASELDRPESGCFSLSLRLRLLRKLATACPFLGGPLLRPGAGGRPIGRPCAWAACSAVGVELADAVVNTSDDVVARRPPRCDAAGTAADAAAGVAGWKAGWEEGAVGGLGAESGGRPSMAAEAGCTAADAAPPPLETPA